MSSPLYKHTLIYVIGRIGPAVINLVATAVFTRLASPTEYSVLVLSMAAAQIGSSGLFQWLRMSVLRYGSGDQAADMVGTITRLYLVQGGICAVIIAIGSASFGLTGHDWLIWITCGVMTLAQSWFDYTQELQRASLQPVRYSLSFGLRALFALILGTLAVLATHSGYGLVGAVALAYLVAPVPFLSAMLGEAKLKSNPALTRKILAYGLPLGFALALNNIAIMGDRFIVAWLIGAHAAGVYGPTVELGRQTIFTLLQSVTLACYPLAIRALRTHGIDAAIEQMAKNLGLLMVISVPVAVGLAVMRVEIAGILLGPQFRGPAADLFPLVAVSTFLLSLNTFYFIQGNQLGESTGGQAFIAAVGAVTAIAANFTLIPLFGLMGAASAGVIAQAVSLATSIIVSRRAFPLPFPPRHLLSPLAAAGVMALMVVIGQHLWHGQDILRSFCLFALAGMSYAVAAVLFNAGDVRHLAVQLLGKRSFRKLRPAR